MPVLSLHNTYSLPSGSASYSLGFSGAVPNVAPSYPYPTQVGASMLDRALLPGGVSNLIGGTNNLHGMPSGLGGKSNV